MSKKLLIPFGHALLLILLHVGYFNLNWSVPLENEMMTAFNKLESYLSGHGKFDQSKYLFVNTAYDQAIIEGDTEYGDVGGIVITDRNRLAKLFEGLNRFGNQHKYVLCDISLDLESDEDSSLAAIIGKVPRVIFPANYDSREHQILKPVFDVKYAQADYVTYEGMVSKIRLYARESKSKTLPLTMYEDCNQVFSKASVLGLFYKGSYIPWSIYPRYFFHREEIIHYEWKLSVLADMLAKGDTSLYNERVRGKILVIGNFTNETHSTPVGEMPGTMILFNTYLTLEDKYHLLGWGWFLFALFSFSVLCFVEFIYKKERPSLTDKTWKKFAAHLLGLTTWCLLVSLFSGLIFRVHITIIPVILYIELFRHIGKLRILK